MDLQLCYNASEDTFPLPLHIKQLYGPFGFPTRCDTHRPYISSNFVMGLDGRASFTELKGRAGGKEASRSKEDRWLMDFLRAHHDGQLIGANTLREEPGTDARGADYGIDDEQLREYREQTLGLDKQKIIVLTGSGNIDTTLRVFDSPRVEPWIVTSAAREQSSIAAQGIRTTRRTQEIGVRMALGALPRDIFTLVLRQVLILVATGVCIGIVSAIAITRWLTGLSLPPADASASL